MVPTKSTFTLVVHGGKRRLRRSSYNTLAGHFYCHRPHLSPLASSRLVSACNWGFSDDTFLSYFLW